MAQNTTVTFGPSGSSTSGNIASTGIVYSTLPDALNKTVSQTPFDPCQFQGHEISEEFVQYVDGLLASRCERCNQRIVMPGVPAGDVPARVQGLTAQLLAEGITPELMAKFDDARRDLKKLSDQVEESQSLMAIATAIMVKGL